MLCHCFYCETLSSGRKLELNIESHFSQSISCALGGPFPLDAPIYNSRQKLSKRWLIKYYHECRKFGNNRKKTVYINRINKYFHLIFETIIISLRVYYTHERHTCAGCLYNLFESTPDGR